MEAAKAVVQCQGLQVAMMMMVVKVMVLMMILLGMELFLVDDEKERLGEPSSSKPIK